MKFEELYFRRQCRDLTQEQAAEILGVSVRTVRRWEDRYEAEGAERLYDRRLGRLAHRMRNLAVKVPENQWPDFKARVTAAYQSLIRK